MQKKKVTLFGSIPMSLSELQMAPAIISAFVKKRGHDFDYHDINLQLFDYCDKNHSTYVIQSEFLQEYNKYRESTDIIDKLYEFIIDKISNTDIILVNVFSVFSQVPALRVIELARTHSPYCQIIIGGIGSHKKILGGMNRFNKKWIEGYFKNVETDIFGQLCLDNDLVDDWQSTVDMDVLEKWLPQHPLISYDKNVEFEIYDLDRYQWTHGEQKIPMLGSYGCVRKCSFCDVLKHFPRYSFVEADVLTKSIIDAYNQTGIFQIQFMDSLVNGSMSNFLNLLKNLYQAKNNGWLPKNFSWSGTYICRPRSSLLDEIHSYLPLSGVDNLVIGVETGSDRIRFEMDKKFLNTDLLYELDAFKTNGVKASALFFPSWPTETEKDFQDSLDLFEKIGRYAQNQTLNSVSLGTHGFSLIDGTPIDHNKEAIGLEQGPMPWLWKCTSNPGLTFWETIRRRLLMAEWCEMHSIRLDEENTFRRYLSFNLLQNRDAIVSHCGNLSQVIDVKQYLPSTSNHLVQFRIINSSEKTSNIRLQFNEQTQICQCHPGETTIVFKFSRKICSSEVLNLSVVFPDNHKTILARYDSGEYYDQQGLYIDQILLDHADITYWGWNQLVDITWDQDKNYPMNPIVWTNFRCLTSGMNLAINMPAYFSPHKYLLARREPELYQERKFLDDRLFTQLESFI